MNGSDKEWLLQQFTRLDEKLDLHGERLACLETKWKMAERFVAVFSGTIALVVTLITRMLWR